MVDDAGGGASDGASGCGVDAIGGGDGGSGAGVV